MYATERQHVPNAMQQRIGSIHVYYSMYTVLHNVRYNNIIMLPLSPHVTPVSMANISGHRLSGCITLFFFWWDIVHMHTWNPTLQSSCKIKTDGVCMHVAVGVVGIFTVNCSMSRHACVQSDPIAIGLHSRLKCTFIIILFLNIHSTVMHNSYNSYMQY